MNQPSDQPAILNPTSDSKIWNILQAPEDRAENGGTNTPKPKRK